MADRDEPQIRKGPLVTRAVTDPGKAVFLSYASQDAEAAQKICEALRAVQIEVWFDRSELRGGDAWDASIRRQIKSCALFIPVISKNTHARGEGYFRLEWKLAVDRSHLMASDLPFLVPVVVDDTPDEEERVPDRFREVQWTRLPGGTNADAFVDHVRRLVSLDPPTSATLSNGAPGSPSSTTDAASRQLKPVASHSFVAWIVGGVLILAMGYFTADKFLSMKHAVPSAKESATPPVNVAEVSDKSIAVLPFADMSEKHDQEYFSDGLAEEVLDRLTQLPSLRVIARTSSFSFKGKPDDIPTIAKKLNVSHILEGSVRKSGEHLRVTAQLIRASTGDHLWSKTYDSDLKDVFKLQDQIAAAVTDALRIQIASPGVALRTTISPEAQSLFMEATYFSQRISLGTLLKSAELAKKAVALDPNYSDAWGRLAVIYSALDSYEPGRGYLALARNAASRAISADPNNPVGHSAMIYVLLGIGDLDGARTEILAQESNPRSASRYTNARGVYLDAIGEWAQASENYREALRLDPVSPILLINLAESYLSGRRLEEARSAFQHALSVAPDADDLHGNLALVLLLQGDMQRALAEAQREPNDNTKELVLVPIYRALGRTKESDAAVADIERRLGARQPITVADAYALADKKDRAMEWLNRAVDKGDPGIQSIRGEYFLYNLRDYPPYQDLLRHLKLPERLAQ
jgi:TolB-like protein/Flp pilus assembly protein TadD